MGISVLDDPAAVSLQRLLEELRAKHGVLGTSLAVIHAGRLLECAAGIANLRTETPVHPDTLFPIGSTSKVFTACMVLQLVQEGKLDLDSRVTDFLPSLPISANSVDITVRQLLTHTSGLDNGPYTDHGRGADAVRRYVETLGAIPTLFEPGTTFSYSNAGFVVAGLIIERLTDTTWDAALRERLLDPLGLHHSSSRPEEAILQATAPGHPRDEAGQIIPPVHWGIAGPSMGPTGSTLACSAGDLARFGHAHLHRRLPGVSGDLTVAMTTTEAELPPGHLLAEGWGIGWLLDSAVRTDGSRVRVYGHNGHNGHAGSYLRVFPDADLVVALLFNSAGDLALYHELVDQIADQFGNVHLRSPYVAIGENFNASSYSGLYRRYGMDIELSIGADAVTAELSCSDPAGLNGSVRLIPASRYVFGTTDSSILAPLPAAPHGHLVPGLAFGLFTGSRPELVYTSVFACSRRPQGH